MKHICKQFALLLVGLSALAAASASAGDSRSLDGVWQDVAASSVATRGDVYIRPAEYRMVALDDTRLASILRGAPALDKGGPGVALTLPMPHGGFERFEIYYDPVMAPELAERYPEIRTYAGHGLDDPTARIRLDRTPAGFHAMVRGAQGTIYVDPYQISNGQILGAEYLSFHKGDVTLSADRRYTCGVHDQKETEEKSSPVDVSRTPTGPTLRTYRLAVATTGEYAQFHGGTVPSALAAVVTAVNRVTGLYQQQLAIRLELIPNNDQLIFTNPGTDGYTNSNGFTMLGQNQSRIDSVIGSGNYDIGHVFSTGGGGIAGLGVVCIGGNKARGVTGLPSPIGDPFYVDFVAHEMGHQFGANHTFNGTAGSCGGGNRNGSTAYEPGSGSTIMAYAGICSSHNIAFSSDDHFHVASFDEIVSYTNFSGGSICDAPTGTGNQAPIVEAGTGTTLPIDTPLRLTGSAVDPDGDTLVYRWEQFDLGPGGSPNAPTGNAPLFRSFPAVSTPTRYLPKLNDILLNTQTIGERLPTYSRNMRFRLIALDQDSGGGGVDYDSVTYSVTDQAGPFDITSQNTTTTWTPGETETVTWNVANTDQAPVNCPQVNILFSSDLGATFTTALAVFTANDGSENIIVPDIQTSVGRISVECANNIFLDINNVNITVLEAPNPDFSIAVNDDVVQVCAPDDGVVGVDVNGIGGFSGSVSMSTSGAPAGVTSLFSPNPVNAGNSTTLTLGNIAAAAPGDYTVSVNGSGSPGTRSDDFTLTVGAGVPTMPTLVSPADGATDLPDTPTLTWDPAAGAEGYLVEIATDSGFTNIVYSASEPTTSHVVASPLAFQTDYFWRVSAQNFCGDAFSMTSTFRTISGPVTVCAFPNASIPDAGAPIESTLTVPNTGSILDLDVFVDASHGRSGHLLFSLRSESTGTVVSLMDQPGAPAFPGGCPTPDVVNTYDDEAAAAAEFSCNAGSPGVGPDAQPDQALSVLDGQELSGDWTLIASDGVSGIAGVLNEWCVTASFEDTPPVDTDGDGVPDDSDNCTLVPNADQRDTNGDGFGNICDADLNNDGVINFGDLGAMKTVFFSSDPDADLDGDGSVSFPDLGLLKASIFGPPGPSGVAP